MKISQLQPNEYGQFYANYLAQVSDEYTLVEELEISVHRLVKFVREIPMDKFDYRYAEGKWTIKDILLHLIDAERVFAYRALRIARNDSTALPGFEEDDYVIFANANQREFESLLQEYKLVREATIALFESFNEEALLRLGMASDCSVSVRAIGYIILGHELHHKNVILERYL